MNLWYRCASNIFVSWPIGALVVRLHHEFGHTTRWNVHDGSPFLRSGKARFQAKTILIQCLSRWSTTRRYRTPLGASQHMTIVTTSGPLGFRDCESNC